MLTLRTTNKIANMIPPGIKDKYRTAPAPDYLAEQLEIRQNVGKFAPAKTLTLSNYMKCHKMVGYAALGYAPDPSEPTPEAWVMSAIKGDYWHKQWQAALVDAGLAPESGIEQFLPKGSIVVGRGDVRMCDGTVISIKTLDASGFGFIESKKPDYDMQLAMECYQLGQSTGVLIVVNRDGDIFKPMEYDCTFDEAVMQNWQTKVQASQAKIKLQSALPLAMPYKGTCRFCDYSKQCSEAAR